MNKNMGTLDKAIRIVLALVMIYFAYTSSDLGWIKYLLYILSVVFILTSLISFCPLYTLFGINTCPSPRK